MECPKCGKDMQPGFLQTAKIVAFNKTRHKISLNPKDKEDIVLASKAFTGRNFQGFICKECGLFVFAYKNVSPPKYNSPIAPNKN